MPEVKVEIEVFCERCDNDLTPEAEVVKVQGHNHLCVEPCEKCYEAGRDEGWKLGYNACREDMRTPEELRDELVRLQGTVVTLRNENERLRKDS